MAKFVFLFFAVITTICSSSMKVAAQNFTLAYAEPTLLSGGVTDCVDIYSSDCTEGLASAVQIVRTYQTNYSDDVLLLPDADRSTAFVQMHPLTWGVNAEVLDYFGLPLYTAAPSLLTSSRDLSSLTAPTTFTKLLMTNVVVAPDNTWYTVPLPVYVHNNIGIILMVSEDQTNSADAAGSCVIMLDRLAYNTTIRATIVMVTDDLLNMTQLVIDIHAATNNHPTVVLSKREDFDATMMNDTILVGAQGTSSGSVTFFTLNFTDGGMGSTVSSVESRQIDLALADSDKDAKWYTDQVFLNTHAAQASANDPVVGSTAEAMPAGRSDDGELRYCQGGECAQGNLFTDAARWYLGTDVAITSSGGLRGPGWAAGPVQISNLWETVPFANTMCTASILGLKLFEMMNYSMNQAQFLSSSTATGDRLLQMSGMRVTVNTQLTYSKLLSIEVLDATESTDAVPVFVPLERLTVYTVAADSYVCNSFSPFETYLAKKYTGESAKVQDTTLIQNAVADFLTSNADWSSDSMGVRISNDTSNTVFMDWVETQSSCSGDTFWDEDVETCKDCQTGFEQKTQGASFCTPTEEDNTSTVLVIAVPLIVCVILVILAVVIKGAKDKAMNVRNVDNAPKSGSLSLLFTDIQDSTKLWGTCPASMSASLEVHHALIRECIAKHKAYEVKTVGDSFMIACGGGVETAVSLAADIQIRLQETAFPKAIKAMYDAKNNEDELDNIDDNPEDFAPLDPTWNGLRVRIGMHYGEPECQFDEVAKGYDYYGPPVNVAARIESVAKGGQISCGSATNKLLNDPASLGVQVRLLGAVELKGVAEPQQIYEILPTTLLNRAFLTFDEMGSKDDESVSDWGGDGTDSETGTGMATAYQFVGPFKKFLAASVKLLKEAERTKLIDLLCKSWRVAKKGGSPDDLYESVVRRIIPSMRKELETESFPPVKGLKEGDGSQRLTEEDSANLIIHKSRSTFRRQSPKRAQSPVADAALADVGPLAVQPTDDGNGGGGPGGAASGPTSARSRQSRDDGTTVLELESSNMKTVISTAEPGEEGAPHKPSPP